MMTKLDEMRTEDDSIEETTQNSGPLRLEETSAQITLEINTRGGRPKEN